MNACPTCGGFVEDGICEDEYSHPTTSSEVNEFLFKKLMYGIVNESIKNKE